jgi:hypothetical protein
MEYTPEELKKLNTKELLTQLKETGLYPCLVNKGIIKLKVNLYNEIDDLFSIRKIVNKELSDCTMQSLMDVSIEFDVHENTVRNAVKDMKR